MKTTANFFKIILLIFLISTFFNCKKEDEETVDTPEIQTATGDIMYIKSIEKSNNPVVSFEYDDSHRLSKMIFYSGSTTTELRCTYDNGKMIKSEVYGDNTLYFKFTYSYDNSGNLERCDFFNPEDNTDTQYWTFENDNGKITSIIEYNDNIPIEKYEFSYMDDSISMIKEYSYSNNNWEMFGYKEYECDNKNNPFYVLQIPFSLDMDEMPLFVNKNNILVEKIYDADGNLQFTDQSVYTYNNKSYPETITEDSTTNTITYY